MTSATRDLVFPPISVLTGSITVTDVHVLSWRIIGVLMVAMVTVCGISGVSRETLMSVKMMKMMSGLMFGCVAVMMMMMMMMMITAADLQLLVLCTV